MSKLLIVESPTKARTIAGMLGKDYHITASMGHIEDLPEREFGVDVENGFKPLYVPTANGRKILPELRRAAADADEIYLAPDPDREGEAIAWHLKEVLGKAVKAPFFRVTFHEITRSAIERALSEKGELDTNLFNAQQARRVLDRIVGYMVSPLLWSRIKDASSAGRVQTAALRLVVEREREISAFVPEEYWLLTASFATAAQAEFAARLFKVDGKDFQIPDAAAAQAMAAAVEQGDAPRVATVSRTDRRRHAPAPFTTSTLQQAANTMLHFSATNTMRYAQSLYEGVAIGAGGTEGLITYMRTDSVTVAHEAQAAARDFIAATYGSEFLPDKPNFYKNKAAAQEAHEAIRPTDVRRTPEQMKPFLDAQQYKLYALIWRRFVASQMAQQLQSLTTVDVAVSGSDKRDYTFRATATETVFQGFGRVYNENGKSADEAAASAELLGKLEAGELLALLGLDKAQKFTEPPPRFSEAALIKELEENGIGRPSTYATTLRTIQDRKYVKRDGGKLIPTPTGFEVIDFLVGKLPELFDIGFTAAMEKELDEVEEGSVQWVGMMEDFYGKFKNWLGEAKQSDAPSAAESQQILALFDGVKFAPAEKGGKRVYDDQKFYTSVQRKFTTDKLLSAKQLNALYSLAAKYRDQLSAAALAGLDDAAKKNLAAAQEDFDRRKEHYQKLHPDSNSEIDFEALFAMFDGVTFDPPSRRGSTVYDDGKFIASLKKQALSGRALSEKQLGALARLAGKYRSSLKADARFDELLKLASPAADEKGAGDGATPLIDDDTVKSMLEKLSRVSEWAAPTRRGRTVYDDRKFYESLSQQFFSGRKLSEPQRAALLKLAGRYKLV